VLRCCQEWFEEGKEARVSRSGRRRGTTAAQDRYLLAETHAIRRCITRSRMVPFIFGAGFKTFSITMVI
jgi:hypothetical protein